MEVVHPRCCGLDVHKASIAACVVIREGGRVRQEKQRFGTTTGELLRLSDWLRELGVTTVAMEATGIYWKPVWHVLEGQLELVLVNPARLKAIPGKKTDMKDGERIADLLQHGLLQGSFVPPAPIRELRDLTRSRAVLTQERVRVSARIEKVLEDANIKLGAVVCDVLGVSSRAMLRAIIAGEQNAAELAQLARKRLRNKIPELEQALAGRVSEHHRFLLQELLEQVEFVEKKIARFEARIAERARPFEWAVTLWRTMPGVDRVTAWSLIAEVGVDMQQFPTPEQLASWAGVCPGNQESAGKRKTGKTAGGSVWLRRALCQAAWAGSRTKGSYFKAQFHRIAARRGAKRAVLAVAHTMLVSGYYMLSQPTVFQDLGQSYFDRLNADSLTRYHVRRLEKLGHRVTLEPAA